MTSISRATSQRYEGEAPGCAPPGRRGARARRTRPASRACGSRELDRGHCPAPDEKLSTKAWKSRRPASNCVRRRDVQEVVDAAVALDDQRLHLDLPAVDHPSQHPVRRRAPAHHPGIALHGHRPREPEDEVAGEHGQRPPRIRALTGRVGEHAAGRSIAPELEVGAAGLDAPPVLRQPHGIALRRVERPALDPAGRRAAAGEQRGQPECRPHGEARAGAARASRRAVRTRAGRAPLAVTACQLREDAPQGNAPAGEQHHAVKPQVGGLRDHPLVALATERGGHDLDGLLADLPADLRLPLGEEARHVGAGWRRRDARLEHALDHLERGRAGAGRGRRIAAAQAGEEAGPRPRMAGDALLVHLHEQGISVAVGIEAIHVLHVAGRLALPPECPPRAGPEMAAARAQRRLERLPVHPGDHQHLAGLRLLHDGGDEPVGVPAEIRSAHGSSRTGTPRSRRYSLGLRDGVPAEVEDRGHERGVGLALGDALEEMLEAAGAARGDDGHRHGLGHRPREGEVVAVLRCRRGPCSSGGSRPRREPRPRAPTRRRPAPRAGARHACRRPSAPAGRPPRAWRRWPPRCTGCRRRAPPRGSARVARGPPCSATPCRRPPAAASGYRRASECPRPR